MSEIQEPVVSQMRPHFRNLEHFVLEQARSIRGFSVLQID
jgi:hypothetical protein